MVPSKKMKNGPNALLFNQVLYSFSKQYKNNDQVKCEEVQQSIIYMTWPDICILLFNVPFIHVKIISLATHTTALCTSLYCNDTITYCMISLIRTAEITFSCTASG